MNNELIYQIALTQVPLIGDIHAKNLINALGEASAVFKATRKQLECIEGIGPIKAASIKSYAGFPDIENEIRFIEKYRITPLFINHPDYPKRLLHCYDNPAMLYYRGTANLNNDRIISIVGTRNNTEYGKMICEKLIASLQEQNIIIVSGLAFGIDSIAHKAAVKNNIPTIGVLAHGLDRIYPSQNKTLAKQMTANGGLLTDFRSGTLPDKQNFPKRNRIAAGLCDALIVIESGEKGGSLITAELANSYNKEVFAFPGRTSDSKSEGCHYLIKNNKAILITSADDLLQQMNWKAQIGQIVQQKKLFVELDTNEQQLMDIINLKSPVHIDELQLLSKLPFSRSAQALLTLEMKGLVTSLPGKLYKKTD